MKAIVTLIRHGQTDDNLNAIIQGWIDSPLNEEGERQAAETGNFLKDLTFDFCFTSDLVRCRKTAELILEKNSKPPPLIVDERIRERYLGELQGKRYMTKYNPHGAEADSKEHITKFLGRLFNFWEDMFPEKAGQQSLLARQAPEDPEFQSNGASEWKDSEEPVRIMLVTHGGPIKTLLPHLISRKGYEGHIKVEGLKIGNCSLSNVHVAGEVPEWAGQVTSVAAVTHLLPQDITVKGDAEV